MTPLENPGTGPNLTVKMAPSHGSDVIFYLIYLTVKSQNRPIEYTVVLYLGMDSQLVSLYTASSGLRDIYSTSPEVGFKLAN